MSRIVLTTIGSLGDLHPMLAIGLALRERGHDVVFAVVKQLRERVESLGFEVKPIRPDQASPDDPEMIARMMDLKKGTERLLRDYIFANLRETYADLLAIAQGADFILTGEVVYATRLVAEKLGIPWALCALSPASIFSIYDPPVLPTMEGIAKLRSLPFVNRGLKNLARSATRTWAKPLHQLRRELGLSPIGNPILDDKFSPHLVLALFSSVLATPQTDWPSNTVQTGFTFYDGTLEGTGIALKLRDFLEAGEPPIVFTLGSAAVFDPGDFYRDSIQAVQQLNRRAVLLMGQNLPPENLPESIIAWDYVPYSEIFPYASAIVHQGGIGTTAQALRAGRPTLVMPYSHDQPDNAARLERLGTSRTIPRQHYQATRAVKELRTLFKPNYAAQAVAVAQRIQSENGAQIACDEIEKQLQLATR